MSSHNLPQTVSSRGVDRAQQHSAQPYIVGFILSLIFTIIPYMLVTRHILTGKVVLGAILAVAVIQMIIQVLFFLHLGREKKPRWQLYFFAGTIVGVLTVVVGSIFIMAHLHNNMNGFAVTQKLAQDEGIAQVEGAKTGACKQVRAEHTVTIKNGVVTPRQTNARLCDGLVFVNEDAASRDIAFGPHEEHVPYAGQEELSISKSQGQMLILSQAGTYHFHDHMDAGVNGTFTVSP